MRALAAIGVAWCIASFSSPAIADSTKIELPKLDGHIADPDNQITKAERLGLDHRMEDFRLATGFALVALVVTSLHDEPIDDLAFRAFNTWKIGEAGKDNGVLIVIATGDRKVRIETGKGVGGSLTDLQSNDIIRNDMAPALKQGKIADAIANGAAHIEAALRGDPGSHKANAVAKHWSMGDWILFFILAPILPILGLLWLVSSRFREWARRSFNQPGSGGGGYYGGGYGGYGGGSGGSSGGSDTGSGYSGDGGSSGGGGSSDSY